MVSRTSNCDSMTHLTFQLRNSRSLSGSRAVSATAPLPAAAAPGGVAGAGDADRPRESTPTDVSNLLLLSLAMLMPLRLRLRPRVPPSVGRSSSVAVVVDEPTGGGRMGRDCGAKGGLGMLGSLTPPDSALLASPRGTAMEARLKATPFDLDIAD